MINLIIINKILYYTHDKWEVEIKYRDDLQNFLTFAYSYNYIKTEKLLKEILDKGHLLMAKGLLIKFNKSLPELTANYFIIHKNSNLLDKFKKN